MNTTEARQDLIQRLRAHQVSYSEVAAKVVPDPLNGPFIACTVEGCTNGEALYKVQSEIPRKPDGSSRYIIYLHGTDRTS